MSRSALNDRPCATCGSANHGSGAHEKLRKLYVNRIDELRAAVEELELAASVAKAAVADALEGALAELDALQDGLTRLDARKVEHGPN